MTLEEEVERALAAARAAGTGKGTKKYLVVSHAMAHALRDYCETTPAPDVRIRKCQHWSGMKWRVLTDPQLRYARDEHLRGYRADKSWNGKIHTCCGARVWYRHKVACPRLEGNAEWKALDSAA